MVTKQMQANVEAIKEIIGQFEPLGKLRAHVEIDESTRGFRLVLDLEVCERKRS